MIIVTGLFRFGRSASILQTANVAAAPSIASHFTRVAGAAAVALGALSCLPSAPAQAQDFGFSYGDSSPWWKPQKIKPQKQKAKKRPVLQDGSQVAAPEKAAKTEVQVAGKAVQWPLVIVVSIKNQRVTVYDESGVIAVSPISSGRVGNPTPMGVFSVLEKNKIHYSNLYYNAPMPNMHRITWSGVALHAGVLPGYPASHGCIRLPHGFSQRLFEMTKMGARVIVTRDDIPVQSFTHQALFSATSFVSARAAPTPPAAQKGAGEKVADASGRTVGTSQSGAGLFSLAAAEAATTDQSATQGTLSPYRKSWLAEIERRNKALADAETEQAAAEDIVKTTSQISSIAAADLKDANAELAAAVQSLAKNEAARNTAEKELDSFARAVVTANRAPTDAEAAASAQREVTIDTKLSELTVAIASEKESVANLKANVKAADDLFKSAEADRVAALKVQADTVASVKQALAAVEQAKRREAKRNSPVAVFISRQTKKLYVRQGYLPIYEAAVEIAEPQKPIGTHVFTALSIGTSARDVSWSVASVPTLPPVADKPGEKKSKKSAELALAKPLPDLTASQTPADALDRIKIPQEARELIEDALKPGSSLIVSDYGMSNETGQFTDFIVGLR